MIVLVLVPLVVPVIWILPMAWPLAPPAPVKERVGFIR
jgi:hypothetical protein